jgi:hypothetical protein
MKLPFMTYVIAFNKVSRCDPGFVTDYTYTSPGDLLNNTRSADVNEGGHIKEQCGTPVTSALQSNAGESRTVKRLSQE